MELSGTIIDIDIDRRRFTLAAGLQKVKVDTRDMPYNPMDSYGYHQLQEGDRVSVSGKWRKN